MKRRNFLLAGGAVAAAGAYFWATGSKVSLANMATRPALKFPPLIDATESRSFTLRAQSGITDFGAGLSGTTSGFNHNYLGPVVKLANGEARARVENAIERDISCHWHGLLLPGEVDGGPHQPIRPGDVWTPTLNINQQPSTPWFHTHIHGETAIGVYRGLAGGLIVSDGEDDSRGLPSTYGIDDLFLVLQDKSFSADGRLTYDQSMETMMHGFTADTMMVNGQVGSTARVPSGLVRLRMLNGCNARILRLAFNDGRPMHLIATDGGYLERPAELTTLRLSPGERAEVLVDFSSSKPAILTSLRDPNAGMGGMMGRFQQFGAKLLGSEFEVLAFAPSEQKARITQLPTALDGKPVKQPSTADIKTRSFSLDMGMGMGMGMGRGMMGGMAINGQSYDHRRINFNVPLGSIERWRVSADMLAHPFHVHGVTFQVVSENGQAPRTENSGWKDTVLVERDVELLARFDQPATENTPFMFHCHILEHEDAGMMGQFTVSQQV